jgi:hypothetical protein
MVVTLRAEVRPTSGGGPPDVRPTDALSDVQGVPSTLLPFCTISLSFPTNPADRILRLIHLLSVKVMTCALFVFMVHKGRFERLFRHRPAWIDFTKPRIIDEFQRKKYEVKVAYAGHIARGTNSGYLFLIATKFDS